MSEITRRALMRRSAVAAGTVVAVGTGADKLAPRYSPIGRAEAIAPIVAYGAVAVGGVAVSAATGWALREYEILGSDDPPEGLTSDALLQKIHQTSLTRQSTNASTFVDNRNIVETGFEHSLYAEGKIDAIESLNNEDAESDVIAAAKAAADDQASTVIRNLLKSWNESVNELDASVTVVEDHADVSLTDAFNDNAAYDGNSDPNSTTTQSLTTSTRTITLPDGSDFELEQVQETASLDSVGDTGTMTWDPEQSGYSGDWSGSRDVSAYSVRVVATDSDDFRYLKFSEWNDIYTLLTDKLSAVKSGLNTWVNGVYGDVQAGELDTADLLTPRELAEMTAEEEDFNQAVADLMALNVAIDLEREAEVYFPDIDATIYGQLALTSEPTGGVNAGDTITPSSADEDYYLTYDVSQGHGDWSHHNTGIDGGTVTFTSEPFPETLYVISTVAGETVEVTAEDFTDQGDGTWTADLSADLETSITEVDSIEFYAETSETRYETILLQRQFEVVTFSDSEGNEYDSADFSQSEPQDDTNYVTEEEWQEMIDRQQELIDKYEDSKSGGAFSFLDGLFGGSISSGVAVAGAALAGVVGIGYVANKQGYGRP